MSNSSINRNYLERAQKLIDLNRFSEAIPILTKAITENPQDYYAMCSLSYCFCQLGENNKCLEYAEKAILVDPEGEWAYRLKGIMLGRQGDRKAGLEFAQKAVYFEPDNELALGNLVYAYLNNGLVKEAREVAEELLEVSPDSEESHYLFGLIEHKSENYQEAEKWFRQALEIAPNYAEARNSLAFAILKQSDKASEQKSKRLEYRALKHLTESVKLDPNNRVVLENIKAELDNSFFYFAMIYLFPLLLFGLWVTPIVTVLGGLFVFGILVNLIRQNNRRRKKLSPEMKNLFKIRNYAFYVGEQSARFVYGGLGLLRKIWLQYLIAFSIFLCYAFGHLLPFSENFYFDLKLIFWGNLIWLFNRIIKYKEPQKKS